MFKDRLTIAFNLITGLSLLWSLWLLLFKLKTLPAQIPLWYTLPSNQRLAATTYLWILPALALSFWLINVALGWWLFRRYPAVSQLLVALSALAAIISAVAVTKIILIYTNLL